MTQVEIEAILDDKICRNVRSYFVKYKDYDSTHSEWKKEKDLKNATALIRKYWIEKIQIIKLIECNPEYRLYLVKNKDQYIQLKEDEIIDKYPHSFIQFLLSKLIIKEVDQTIIDSN